LALDVKNGNNTNFLYFNALNNPNLTCINVDNSNWSNNNWSNIDAQSSFNEECEDYYTYVPDDNFEQALIDLGYDFGPLDDYVLTVNINTVIELHLGAKNIIDLTGIENFTALEKLYCNHNFNLQTIDLSNNLNLNYLYARGCVALQNLNLINNTQLAYLNLSFSSVQYPVITTIDLSNLTLLDDLNLDHCNSLEQLNLSNNIGIENLTLIGCNSLQNLELSGAYNLKHLDLQYSIQLQSLDLGDNTSLEELSILDDYSSTTIGLSSLDLSNNINLKKLNINNLTLITSLDLSNNINLEELSIDRLTSLSLLDISSCLNLKKIDLIFLQSLDIDALDFSNYSLLQTFDLRYSNMVTIDLSNNPLLTSVLLLENQDTSLINLQNGNNTILQTFASNAGCYGNTACILVDDINWFHANFSSYYCGFSPLTAFCGNLSIDEEFLEETISIYPNPVKSKLSINLKDGIELKAVAITDITGKIIQIINIKEVDFTNYNSGIYFMKITTDKGEVVRKIVKE